MRRQADIQKSSSSFPIILAAVLFVVLVGVVIWGWDKVSGLHEQLQEEKEKTAGLEKELKEHHASRLAEYKEKTGEIARLQNRNKELLDAAKRDRVTIADHKDKISKLLQKAIDQAAADQQRRTREVKAAEKKALLLKAKYKIHAAAATGDVDDMNAFVKAGVDIDRINYRGVTPLYVASAMNQLEVARILIAAKANVNAENKYGSTPLSISAHPEMKKLLLRAGAKVKPRESIIRRNR